MVGATAARSAAGEPATIHLTPPSGGTTATTMTTSQNPSQYGQNVKLTATVNPPANGKVVLRRRGDSDDCPGDIWHRLHDHAAPARRKQFTARVLLRERQLHSEHVVAGDAVAGGGFDAPVDPPTLRRVPRCLR